MDTSVPEKSKHAAPTRRGTRGGRRGGRRPYFEKKKTQRRIELDAVSEAYKSFQIEPEIYQVLVPLDPDFLYDVSVLDFDLRVSRHYPHQGERPSIFINNKEIARGHAANVERAFAGFEGSLLERIQRLVSDLESLLALPPVRTVTIVRGRGKPPKNTNDGIKESSNGMRGQPGVTEPEAVPKLTTNGGSSGSEAALHQDPVSLLDSVSITEPPTSGASDSESDSESDSALGPAPGAHDSDSSSSESDPEPESDSDSEYKHDSDDEDIDMGGGPRDMAKPKREGTEIVFPDMTLINIAVCEIASLNLLFQCGRCKTAHTFRNLQSGEYGKPSKPRAEQCEKCELPLMVAFRKEFLHSMSHTAGYLDVDGGKPVDLLPSSYSAMCSQCQTQAPVFKNVDLGALRLQSCRNCHTKMSLKIELFNFSLLSTETINAAAKRSERGKLPPSAPKQRLNLTGGEPLPNEGRCAHYRRSQRWFRFSCCQRVFACDKCHDAEMRHAAEQANRMLCGFCSREQRFSQNCKACGHDFTIRHARFWEGGKGARDRTQMSRKDSRKFKRTPEQRSQKQTKHFQGKSKPAVK